MGLAKEPQWIVWRLRDPNRTETLNKLHSAFLAWAPLMSALCKSRTLLPQHHKLFCSVAPKSYGFAHSGLAHAEYVRDLFECVAAFDEKCSHIIAGILARHQSFSTTARFGD